MDEERSRVSLQEEIKEPTDKSAGAKKAGRLALIIGGIVAGVLVAACAAVCGVAASRDTVLPGTSVLGVDVGGLTPDQIRETWEKEGAKVCDETEISFLMDGEELRTVSLSRLGVSVPAEDVARDAWDVGHDGNFLTKVVDDALPIYRSGSFKFQDDDNTEETEYTYNGNGYLTSDRNKGIARIDYDMNNHPVRIQFTNGNVTEYVYSVSGEKLRTIYRTAVSNISVPMGTTHTLTQGETLSVDSTDYCFGGSLILRNGRLSRYLFDGGYCSFTRVPSIGNLQYATTFHYYQQDHLGNIREVINGNNGTVEQQTHYYPFGGIISDISTNQSLQPNKYNGKELDLMHGYDYGIRISEQLINSIYGGQKNEKKS